MNHDDARHCSPYGRILGILWATGMKGGWQEQTERITTLSGGSNDTRGIIREDYEWYLRTGGAVEPKNGAFPNLRLSLYLTLVAPNGNTML
jgi:hypothetical protein